MDNQPSQPGKVLTIIGFIMAFLPLQLIGLTFSIIGLVQSRQVHRPNGLAVAGIVLNAIGLFLVVPLAAITIVSYNGITQRANDNTVKATANSVLKFAEVYAADNETYPTTIAEFKAYAEETYSTPTNILTNVTFATAPIVVKPVQLSTIEFYSCDGLGNKIGYWDSTYNSVYYLYAGQGDTATCTLATE